MDKQTVGTLPDFTEDSVVPAPEEVKPTEEESKVEEEKETPSTPLVEEKPDSPKPVVDTGELEIKVDALQKEKVELLKQLQELRGVRRDLREQENKRVDSQLDELKDLHPEDVKLVEKILRNRGYMTKEEVGQMHYEAVKKEEITRFLDEFPEYKPENDPNDLNWQRLEREMAWYRKPDDARQLGTLLRKVHRSLVPSSDRVAPIKQRQVQVASVGSGGAQRSSSKIKTLDSDRRAMLMRGGWSEEDIKKIEQRLPE